MTQLYILVHDEENRAMTFDTLKAAQTAFYMQWRKNDGSIPWQILYAEHCLNPSNGNIAGPHS